jgi:hypothetical protein
MDRIDPSTPAVHCLVGVPRRLCCDIPCSSPHHGPEPKLYARPRSGALPRAESSRTVIMLHELGDPRPQPLPARLRDGAFVAVPHVKHVDPSQMHERCVRNTLLLAPAHLQGVDPLEVHKRRVRNHPIMIPHMRAARRGTRAARRRPRCPTGCAVSTPHRPRPTPSARAQTACLGNLPTEGRRGNSARAMRWPAQDVPFGMQCNAHLPPSFSTS